MPADSQQHLAQDPAPSRGCGMDRRIGHHGREGENGDGNRDEAGAGTRTSTVMSMRVGMGARTGAEMGTIIDIRVEGRQSL